MAEHRRRLVPRFVQVLVVFGILGTVGQVNTSWPVYKEHYQIGFQKDQLGDYTIRLIKDDALVHLRGALSFGVSEDVERLLQMHPDIEGIVLDSFGGRVYEGRELSKLIFMNELDTYSLAGCYSACTTAFISGKNRFLGLGANLAFHQYGMTNKNLDAFDEVEAELLEWQEEDLQMFQRQGVDPQFLAKLFDTAGDDFWYPTVDEMLSAGVIHGIVNPSDIAPIKYGESEKEFQEVFEVILAIPVFKTIKQYAPETYREVVESLKKQFKQNATGIEIQNTVSSHVTALATRFAPKSSDSALINFARVSVNAIKKLEEKDPILCVKFLSPQQYGPVYLSRYLSRDEMAPMLDALSRIIIDAYEKESPVVDTQAAERLMEKLVLQLGEDAEYLEPLNLQNREQYKRHCGAVVAFYEFILREKTSTAGNALRYAFGAW